MKKSVSILQKLLGYLGLNLVKEAGDRAIVILVWDSAANEDNGAKTFSPTWFAKCIAPQLASE